LKRKLSLSHKIGCKILIKIKNLTKRLLENGKKDHQDQILQVMKKSQEILLQKIEGAIVIVGKEVVTEVIGS
jgi:hypothetical protein